MFEDALFATNHRRSPQQRWAALMSFVLQATFVTVIVALPLFFTEALPLDYVRSFVEVPLPPQGRAPTPPQQQSRQVHSDSNLNPQGQIIAVRQIPRDIATLNEEVAPPRLGDGIGVVGAPVGDGIPDGVIGSIVHETERIARNAAPPPPTKPFPISHIDEGLLVHKVTPVYPQIAILARQQGTVVMHAIIGRDGRIEQLQAVSGPPLLIKAAVDAVAQWRYRPYVLNGEPVEVETQITVNFKLGG